MSRGFLVAQRPLLLVPEAGIDCSSATVGLLVTAQVTPGIPQLRLQVGRVQVPDP